MSNLVEYAKAELARIDSDDKMQKLMNKHIIDMVELFAEEGHSGFSASYAIEQLERLLRFLPLTELTGEDDEWNEYSVGEYQNKRCSTVFKDKTGAYDINGYVFSDDGGETWYTNRKSRKYIKFPYYPPTRPERIHVTKEE